MPRRARLDRVSDMLEQLALLREHTGGVTRAGFLENTVLQGDVLHRITVLGEAVGAVPAEVRDRYPAIPWRDIRNMRNVVVHVYFGIDLDRVWDVVERDLAPLSLSLTALLDAEERPEA